MTLNSKMSFIIAISTGKLHRMVFVFGRNCLYRTKYLNRERKREKKNGIFLIKFNTQFLSVASHVTNHFYTIKKKQRIEMNKKHRMKKKICQVSERRTIMIKMWIIVHHCLFSALSHVQANHMPFYWTTNKMRSVYFDCRGRLWDDLSIE